jgi:excisionase family DNA binding protein
MTNVTETADATVSALEAAQILNYRLGYVYSLLAERKLEAERVYGQWRVSRESLEQFKASRRAAAQG